MNSLTDTTDTDNKSEFSANLNIFRQIEFFSGVSMDVMKLFAFLCKRQSYKPGDAIFLQDEDDQCAYYILSGAAKLILKKDGKDYGIREYKAESYLGVLSLMAPMVKQFSLVATADTTCIAMTRKAFAKIVDQFPDTPLKIIRAMGQRIAATERKCIMEFEPEKKEDLRNLLGISLI
jgi:CRP-like cAMP-binding protein